MATEIPLEILQTILSHHSGDVRQLRACSLVCRNWVTGAQSLLFKSISLTGKNYCAFSALIRDSPHIALLVRKLVIEGWSSYALYSPKDVYILARILDRLRQVYHIVFSRFHFAYYGSYKLPPQLFTAISAFLTSLPYPAQISFQNCVFTDFAVVLQFLEARQQEMHTLSFSCSNKPNTGNLLSVFHTIPTYEGATKTILETLHITDCNELEPEIAGFLVHPRVTRSLSLNCLQELRCGRDAAAILLPHVSGHLRSFVLEIRDPMTFSSGTSTDHDRIATLLRSSCKLRSFKCVVISRWGNFYPWILSTISSFAPHPCIEEITIDSVIDKPDLAEDLTDLKPLDDLICRTPHAPFPALTKIRFRLPKHDDSLLLRFYSADSIAALFPQIALRGLLSIEEVGETQMI